jgi:uncharacterized membrane protein
MPTPADPEDDLEAADPREPPPSEVSRSEASRDARRRVTIQAETSVSYISPLPPPEILAGYSRTQADAPERILAMVERQEAHRQQMEKTVVEAGAANASKAINVTAYIATLFVGASVYMVHEHYAVYGIVTLGSTLAALAGANLYGKAVHKKERTEKERILTESDQNRQDRRQIAGSKPPPEQDDAQ